MNKKRAKPQELAASGKQQIIDPSAHPDAVKKEFGFMVLDTLKYDGRYLYPGDRSKLEKLSEEQINSLKAQRVIE